MPLTPMLFKGQILFSESLSQTQSFDPEHLRNLGVDWEISSIFFIFVSHWFCKQQSKLKSEWSPQIPNHHHFRPPPKRSFTNFLTQSLLQGHNKTFRYQYQRERNLIYFNILVLNFSLIMITCLWQKKKTNLERRKVRGMRVKVCLPDSRREALLDQVEEVAVCWTWDLTAVFFYFKCLWNNRDKKDWGHQYHHWFSPQDIVLAGDLWDLASAHHSFGHNKPPS